MTRKHFAALAAELRRCRDRSTNKAEWRRFVDGIASFCAAQNSRFSRQRFLIAAGAIEAPPKPPRVRVKRPSVAARTLAALGASRHFQHGPACGCSICLVCCTWTVCATCHCCARHDNHATGCLGRKVAV